MSSKTLHKVLSVALLLAVTASFTGAPTPARAEAAWVKHEGNIVPAAPRPGESVEFWVQAGYQEWITNVRLYYTTNGTEPAIDDATHTPLDATHSVDMEWDHDEPVDGGVSLWYRATLGPWSEGSVVRYKIAAWHRDGGSTRWADSSVEFPLTTAGKARVFGFRVGQNVVPGWVRSAVIYNVFVDRFFDGDPSNNQYCDLNLSGYCDHSHAVHVPAGPPEHPQDDYRYTYNGGDLAGVIQRLPYLKRLGVNVIWLSPVFENTHFHTTDAYSEDGDVYFTYHGYHPSDPEEVEPVFGDLATLQDLVDEARHSNMRVLLDFVPNHVSNQNDRFVDASTRCTASPYYNWFTFSACSSTPEESYSVDFPVGFTPRTSTYTFHGANDTYRSFFGVQELPQIDNDEPAARAWVIEDRAVGWLDELGHAGYRLDYVPGPSTDFWRAFEDAMGEVDAGMDSGTTRDPISAHDDLLTIAEIWTDTTDETIRRHLGRVDAAMDFDMAGAIKNFFTEATGDPVDTLDAALQARASVYYDYDNGYTPSEFVRACFLDNHDLDRFAHLIYERYPDDAERQTNKMMNAALLQFTQPCVPVINYGNEVGLGQEFDKEEWDIDGDGNNEGRPEYVRERMPWTTATARGPVPTEWQGEANIELFNWYDGLTFLRRALPPLVTLGPDDVTPLYRHNDNRTYAYLRRNGEDTVLVAFNDDTEAHTLVIPNLPGATLPYPNGTELYSALGGGAPSTGRTLMCTVIGGRCTITLDPAVMPGTVLDDNCVSEYLTNYPSAADWNDDPWPAPNPQLGPQTLHSLRLFRDKIMRQTPAGEQLIDQYYRYSIDVIRSVVLRPQLGQELQAILYWLAPSLERYVYGQSNTQDIFTSKRYWQLNRVLNELQANADPECASMIKFYRQQFPLQQFVGKPMDSLIAAAVQQFILSTPNGN